MEIDNEVTSSQQQSPSSSYQSIHPTGVKKLKLDVNTSATDVVAEDPGEGLSSLNYRASQLEEYEFPATDPQEFQKNGKLNEVGEIFDLLKSTNMQRRDHMAVAELCPTVKRPRLITNNKGNRNIAAFYGFDVDDCTYLHPEEALYLVETGRLEVLTEGVPVSVERARLLFLESKLIPSCSAADYAVYKHFSKVGYRLRRRMPEYLSDYPPEDSNSVSDVQSEKPMDQDTNYTTERMDETEVNTRGIKRRAESSHPEPHDVMDSGVPGTSTASKSKDKPKETVIVEDDSDCEFLEEVEIDKEPKGSTRVTVLEEDDAPLFGDQVSMDEAFLPSTPHYSGSSAAAAGSPSSTLAYIVVESDSDVEFVDEVSLYAVMIEEIPSDSDSILSCEAGPSSSKPSQVFVDLVSSDSENEAEILECEYYDPIWSKCIPNSKIQITFPPAAFLPGNISPRSGTYEYSFVKGPQDQTPVADDIEIDTILDKVRLEGDVSSGGCWKEWRETTTAEATNLFNESLLGEGRAEARDNGTWNWSKRFATSNLHQWKFQNSESEQSRKESKSIYVPYDLYPQSAAHVHRNSLGVIVKPIHRVAVVREDELIPDAGQFPLNDDEAPLVVTVVGQDSNIVQLLCNVQPIQSLF